MPSIRDLLDRESVLGDLRASDKEGVIREFADVLARTGKVRDVEELVQAVKARENQGSTGIGEGIAIPHAKSRAIGDVVVAFGRSKAGVDFQAHDGKPAHLFFLLVAPEDRPSDHLKVLARISRIMRNALLRERLMACGTQQEMRQLILDEDGKYPLNR